MCIHENTVYPRLQRIVVALEGIPSVLKEVLNTRHNRALISASLNEILPASETSLTVRTHVELRRLMEWIVYHNLTDHTWARLQKSQYGVGVFAIRDIPAGTRIFESTLGCVNSYPVFIQREEMRDPAIRQLLDDFLVPDERGEYPVPALGMNSVDITFFLNHSAEAPNITETNTDDCDMGVYLTSRPVRAGEELLLDYREFAEKDQLRATMPWLFAA